MPWGRIRSPLVLNSVTAKKPLGTLRVPHRRLHTRAHPSPRLLCLSSPSRGTPSTGERASQTFTQEEGLLKRCHPPRPHTTFTSQHVAGSRRKNLTQGGDQGTLEGSRGLPAVPSDSAVKGLPLPRPGRCWYSAELRVENMRKSRDSRASKTHRRLGGAFEGALQPILPRWVFQQ